MKDTKHQRRGMSKEKNEPEECRKGKDKRGKKGRDKELRTERNKELKREKSTTRYMLIYMLHSLGAYAWHLDVGPQGHRTRSPSEVTGSNVQYSVQPGRTSWTFNHISHHIV